MSSVTSLDQFAGLLPRHSGTRFPRRTVVLDGETTRPLSPVPVEPLTPAERPVTVAELRAREGMDPWPPSEPAGWLRALWLGIILVVLAVVLLAVLATYLGEPAIPVRPAVSVTTVGGGS